VVSAEGVDVELLAIALALSFLFGIASGSVIMAVVGFESQVECEKGRVPEDSVRVLEYRGSASLLSS
jgi:hypothetical protein